MFSIRLVSALAAAALFSMASADDSSSSSKIVSIPTPTATLPAAAMDTIGCFSTGVPLEDHGKGKFVTAGSCQQICLGLDKDVLGLSEGDHCWCGDKFPPKNTKIDDNQCSTTCSGDDRTLCGGDGKLWIMSTGNSRNQIEYADPIASSSSSSASPSTTASPTSSSAPADSAIASSAAAEPEKKGPNTAGIAAGVVVGVVVLAAVIGGVFFYLRRQKRLAVEEEYRRQAAANSFISGGKLHTSNSSMTDSRLDPEFMARRQSNGSIADNEDYSRRILKVTNA